MTHAVAFQGRLPFSNKYSIRQHWRFHSRATGLNGKEFFDKQTDQQVFLSHNSIWCCKRRPRSRESENAQREIVTGARSLRQKHAKKRRGMGWPMIACLAKARQGDKYATNMLHTSRTGGLESQGGCGRTAMMEREILMNRF